MADKPESYLIVGSGVFGASTAFHLQLAKPTASITLIDRTPFPNPSAASHGLNKIVCADYGDIFYMKLALEAVEHWRTNPIFKDYYHESGIALLENVNMGRGALENYRKLGVDVKAEILSVEDARGRFGGVYEEAEWEGAKECYWNPGSGWGEGEGEGALRSIIEAAVEAGVFYVEATVERLCIDSSGICTGVSMTDGEVMSADHVILCTGARTAQLLADIVLGDKDL
ncbi:FAD dependent oxidoreductase [Rhexocercosporidium sp. MPI-PUGE-AT-0058]|nr:FAD dependent oxidoreductase [Rhexocercosporidium sp. MPI-PUGE-AT-0058]